MGRVYSKEADDAHKRAKCIEMLAEVAGDGVADARRFAAEWIESLENAGTAIAYARATVDWLAFCVSREIDPFGARRRQAQIYLQSMSRLAPSTRAQRCAILRSFYDAAIDDDAAVVNAFRKIQPRNRDAITPTPDLSREEFERVLGHIRQDAARERSLHAIRDFVVVFVAGRIGLRRHEVRDLTWRHVGRRDEPTLTVHGKGDKWVTMPIPADVARALDDWRHVMEAVAERAMGPTDAVVPQLGRWDQFTHEGGVIAGVSPRQVSRIVEQRLHDAGFDVPRGSAHMLRATAATVAYHNGADLFRLMAQLRHASLQTTEGYVRRHEDSKSTAAASWGVARADLPASPSSAATRTGSARRQGRVVANGPSRPTPA